MDKLQTENRPNSENIVEFINGIQSIDDKSVFLDPSELPDKIVAIGDIHGDLEALFKILLDARIIDINGKWIAINTFLVQTGDIFDKGRKLNSMLRRAPNPKEIIDMTGNVKIINALSNSLDDTLFAFGTPGDELVIIKFLTDLHQQAIDPTKAFGKSRVILCSGNHEFWYGQPILADTIISDGYYHPYDYTIFGTPENRFKLLKPGGVLANKFAEILKAIVIVGDFVFLHGGLDTDLLQSYNFTINDFDNINQKLKDFFLGNPISHAENDILNNLLNFREQNTRDCTKFVNFITEQLHRPYVNIVVGHTADMTTYDNCNTNMNGISSVYDIKRKNADGTLKPCINLPVLLCNSNSKSAYIYKIDTHISRMSGTYDYREPKLGSLNSLIIELNPDGTKKNVFALNSYLYSTTGLLSQPIVRS
jgi:UDP-2,3-diacylglucosamine pyrophosphatase LpxH